MRRYLAIVAALVCLMSSRGAAADGAFSVAARGACLIEADTGRELFAQNADARCPMASTTKVMTCLLALENGDLDAMVTAGPNAAGVEGTSIYLAEGESLSLRHMLYGLMLRSGNDAAVAVAEHIGGSVEHFAAMMNARAAELDADAVFVNPHGLPAEGHAASARAMVLIARAALRLPEFREIVSTRRATIPWVGNEYARVLTNKNKLLTTYEGATGVKTGFTRAAGRCLVFSARREDMELIGCVLNCPDWFGEAARMLDYGFERYHRQVALAAGEAAVSVPVRGARQTRLQLCAAADLAFPADGDEAYAVECDAGPVRAPVRAGDALGEARLVVNGETLARVDLLASEDMEAWGLWPALRRIWARWQGGWAGR